MKKKTVTHGRPKRGKSVHIPLARTQSSGTWPNTDAREAGKCSLIYYIASSISGKCVQRVARIECGEGRWVKRIGEA